MDPLETNILHFLRTGVGDFDEIALALFTRQFEKNQPYQAYCRMQDRTPGSVRRWQDIPAVPVGAFKSAELVTFPIGQAAAVFESSGTTREVKSRHYLRTLTYYETALKSDFAQAMADSSHRPLLILTPPPAEAPHSSLAWMLDVIRRTYGTPGSVIGIQRGRLDDRLAAKFLDDVEQSQTPVSLLGTTIAFLGLIEYAEKTKRTWRLPAGSRLMDTGGMKTEKRHIVRPEFVQQVQRIFGIPADACVNEYGMSELSSQFYGRGASSYLEGPAWTRTLVIDPATGEACPQGKRGLLRHFDLANVDSVLAVQTEDLAIAERDGFVLLGRDPSAAVKGCSLAAEAFLA